MSDLVGNPEDWFSHNEAQLSSGTFHSSYKDYESMAVLFSSMAYVIKSEGKILDVANGI